MAKEKGRGDSPKDLCATKPRRTISGNRKTCRSTQGRRTISALIPREPRELAMWRCDPPWHWGHGHRSEGVVVLMAGGSQRQQRSEAACLGARLLCAKLFKGTASPSQQFWDVGDGLSLFYAWENWSSVKLSNLTVKSQLETQSKVTIPETASFTWGHKACFHTFKPAG